ncbi:MAG: HEAT repeat domain-containing protein, partial [Candidatus Kariarchaeaceae archaeon]
MQDLKYSAERRIQAVFHLLKHDNLEVVEILAHSLSTDPNSIVRHECAYALGEINGEGHEDTVEMRIIALSGAIRSDGNRFVKHEAALAIANLANISSKGLLENLLNSKDTDIVDTAEIALQRLKNKTN